MLLHIMRACTAFDCYWIIIFHFLHFLPIVSVVVVQDRVRYDFSTLENKVFLRLCKNNFMGAAGLSWQLGFRIPKNALLRLRVHFWRLNRNIMPLQLVNFAAYIYGRQPLMYWANRHVASISPAIFPTCTAERIGSKAVSSASIIVLLLLGDGWRS